jgi:putative DNA methylase
MNNEHRSKGRPLTGPKRKLIEVALPLETINRESAREKSIRHGHPSTLHLWWARRPLAAARAVLFAQLVDDPSSHPDRFPTEEAQRVERQRLHGIIERLVVWKNIRDQALLAEAHEEILKSTGGKPPAILDPFAGGGTIPLEAQRLGLEAHASDLNPVAVLINKALIEIPPKFAGRVPVFPGLADRHLGGWEGATGLTADVHAYGEWMRNEAESLIGEHYPKVTLEDGTKATVIAWIWARTVTCPNPACGIEMPLVSSWWLGKKTGKEAWIRPIIVPDAVHPSGKRVEFEIGHGAAGPPTEPTKSRRGATCVACGTAVSQNEIKAQGQAGGLGRAQMAVVAEGGRRRVYLATSAEQIEAACVPRPDSGPDQELGYDPRNLWTPPYGLTRFSDLFTNRQLLALTTFSDLVTEARERVLTDALAAGATRGDRLESGGADAEGYADAVATYLGLAVSKSTDMNNMQVTWKPSMDQAINLFKRQAIPMTWDFPETPPLSDKHAGGFLTSLGGILRAVAALPAQQSGVVAQCDASKLDLSGFAISTDPPYYDNIGYSDLSDFFYVWLRRSLRTIHPALLSTMLVPKAEELVANPYRHGGKNGAKTFFEDGFRFVFTRARETALADYPITVYYAFKQSDAGDDGTASTGWETLLDGMIRSGWAITATWPIRSELSNRMLSQGTNALASSIVLALRPRPDDAPMADRRGLIAALQNELPDALRKLQQGAIAPVDLPQAVIGPGMAVFSRYAKVIENDGTTMTVRSALGRINEILDQVLNEQEGDFDAASRFAIAWYRQNGYTTGRFGVADDLARARNTAVETLVRDGILTSAAGKVTLLSPANMPDDYDVIADDRVGAWEVLHHLIVILERDGLPATGAFLRRALGRPNGAVDIELVKELAFLLFSIAEKNGWTRDALAFNTVATAWPDIVQASRSTPPEGDQSAFDFSEED